MRACIRLKALQIGQEVRAQTLTSSGGRGRGPKLDAGMWRATSRFFPVQIPMTSVQSRSGGRVVVLYDAAMLRCLV